MPTLWRTALLLLLALPPFEEVHAQGPIVVRSLVGRTGRVVYDTMGTPLEVPYPPGATFAALAAVYEDLKVPAEVRDSVHLEVGNTSFFKRGDIGGQRLSLYLECGSGPMGIYADNYRLDLSLVSFVRPSSAGSTVIKSVLLGSAVNVNDGGSRTKTCLTTGMLERRLHQLVLKKLDK